MDINNAASSRAAYYDRGSVAFTIGYYITTVGPHGMTTRDTYTVPANRKAIVNGMVLSITRRGVPATINRVQAIVSFIAFGLGVDNISGVDTFTGTVGDSSIATVSPSFVMFPGDEIYVRTVDISVGGTNMFNINVMITEFDF